MTEPENVEPTEPQVPVIQYMSGVMDEKDHTNCSDDSPCKRPQDFEVVNAVGVRAVVANGEKWLSRDDVLLLLARTYEGYIAVHEKFHHQQDDPEAQAATLSTFISAQTVNLIGAQLHRLTDGDGINATVPDTIPTDWLSEQPGAKPAPESPIETAIRKAKEAALEAQRAKEEGK